MWYQAVSIQLPPSLHKEQLTNKNPSKHRRRRHILLLQSPLQQLDRLQRRRFLLHESKQHKHYHPRLPLLQRSRHSCRLHRPIQRRLRNRRKYPRGKCVPLKYPACLLRQNMDRRPSRLSTKRRRWRSWFRLQHHHQEYDCVRSAHCCVCRFPVYEIQRGAGRRELHKQSIPGQEY